MSRKMKCWNCGKLVIPKRVAVYYYWQDGRDFEALYHDDERCMAILKPERKKCDRCGRVRRVFLLSTFAHTTTLNVPVCKECLEAG